MRRRGGVVVATRVGLRLCSMTVVCVGRRPSGLQSLHVVLAGGPRDWTPREGPARGFRRSRHPRPLRMSFRCALAAVSACAAGRTICNARQAARRGILVVLERRPARRALSDLSSILDIFTFCFPATRHAQVQGYKGHLAWPRLSWWTASTHSHAPTRTLSDG